MKSDRDELRGSMVVAAMTGCLAMLIIATVATVLAAWAVVQW